tara:strand:- start:1001 stop:1210 length:210 start_codon:yes stop_codon:yes gene_type:complete
MAELVTIAEFQNVNDAYILKTRIESEGIRVYLQDENVNNILSAFSFASVKLQVSLNDSFRVMDILYEEN